jgi:dTDP-4-dehydrorhamnose reductase
MIKTLQGDEIASQILPSSMIIRTSWVYSAYGHNFVKTMIRLGKERDTLGVIFDQIGTPTYAHDLALSILSIIQKVETGVLEKSKMAGVFHYSNEGVSSWYDFAKAIFRIENINCKVNPIETRNYPTPAKRPPFSLLNKHKIKTTFGIEIPHWEESLVKCLEKIGN